MVTASTSTPPVVAVVVAHDPGPWFREALESLRDQRYPALAVLVIDAGSEVDPTPLVHEVLPSAAVHRLDANPGYGAAANVAPSLVSGAGFLLFLHDDVALDPDAVVRLVEESFRSNAGVAGPKLLDWSEPRRIRSVGNAVDKAGVYAPYAEPGELDQEQHDRVRDVFSIQGGCILIRADLFETLGGFDPGIDYLGDDLDLCWRAHVVGARVLVAPEATARHLEAMAARGMPDERRRRLARHRVRTMAKCYGWVDLLVVVPQAFVLAVAEALFAVLTGRFRQARDVMGAWTWNLARLGPVVRGRRHLKRIRRVRDRDIRRLQVRGSARLTAFLRGQIGEGSRIQDYTERGRALAGTLSEGPRRMAMVVWGVLGIVFLFGARHLVTRGLVPVGQFLELPDRGALLYAFSSGWNEAELGSAGAAPAGLGLLGLGATAMLGATGLLRQVLVLGLIPLGWVGSWRLAGPLGSRRGRLVAAVVYAALPLPYDAINQARWDVLLLYGTMPWIVLRLARLIGVTPYGDRRGAPGPGVPSRSLWHQVVALALLLAVVAAFEPVVVLMAPALAAVLVVASGLTGNLWAPLRAVFLAAAAAVLAAVLHLPWLLRFRSDPDALWSSIVGPHRGGPGDLVDLLRFDVGRFGDSALSWGLVAVAVLSLLLGREWRAAWAPRALSIALASYAAAWVAGNDLLGVALPDAATLLVPAGVGLAWAGAISFAAFELDVPRFATLGRRTALAVGVVALALGVVPAVAAATDGDYGYPDTDLSGALRFIDPDPSAGSFRVLWMGEPDLLPVPGREVGERLWVTVSTDGLPDVRSAWTGPPSAATDQLVAAVRTGIGGETSRLGRLVTPFGVRYLVVPQALAPSFADVEVRPADPAVLDTLASQLDLRRIASDPSVVVYENVSWRPVRSLVGDVDTDVLVSDDPQVIASTRFEPATPVLTTRVRSTEFRGPVGPGTVIAAVGEAERWRLEVDGSRIDDGLAFGWAPSFEVTTPGEATLTFAGSSGRWIRLLLQWVAWVLVARVAFAEVRVRRGGDDPGESGEPGHEEGSDTSAGPDDAVTP